MKKFITISLCLLSLVVAKAQNPVFQTLTLSNGTLVIGGNIGIDNGGIYYPGASQYFADTSGNIWYSNGEQQTDSSANFYTPNVASGQFLVSGGAGSPVTGATPTPASISLTGTDGVYVYEIGSGTFLISGSDITVQLLDTGLYAYYKMDESGTGSRSSGTNSITLTSSNGVQSVPGIIGNSGSYNGTNQELYTNSIQMAGWAQYTLSAWIKTTASTTAVIMGEWGNGGPQQSAQIYILSGTIHINCTTSNNFDLDINSGTACNDGNWHLVTATYSGSSVSLYVDAVLDATTAASGIMGGVNGNEQFIFGNNYGNSYFFLGCIDEAGVWQTGLNSSQVNNLFNSGTGRTLP